MIIITIIIMIMITTMKIKIMTTQAIRSQLLRTNHTGISMMIITTIMIMIIIITSMATGMSMNMITIIIIMEMGKRRVDVLSRKCLEVTMVIMLQRSHK